jgi:hypothetical protein
MHRRRIVTISGSGRTGSTLLSLLLTQHKNVFNIAQLRDLWMSYQSDATCSCGHRLPVCPVWSRAITTVFGSDPTTALSDMRGAQKRFFAQAARLPDWSDAAAIETLAGRHVNYTGQLTTFLDALQEVTDATTFVDTSKSPQMALAFSMTEGTDVRVLNLARDPRAVAVSWRLRRSRLSAAWKYSRIWAERQRVLEVWSRRLGDSFLQVRYEDLAAAPQQTVEEIQAWAGLPTTPGLFDTPAHAILSWEHQHLYPPANERVLAERATKVTIRPSDSWRDERHRLTHVLALWGSGAQGRRYVQASRDPIA